MLKKYLAALTMVAAGMSAVSGALAAENSLVVKKGPEALILERLQKARPEITFGQPRQSPLAGLYQVQVAGGPVLYVDAAGEKFIAGEIFSIDSDGFSRVEDPYILEERQRLIAKINPDETIIFKPSGRTKAVVYVFTDVDCGYCRLLHRQIHTYEEGGKKLPGYNDLGIEIRYLAYPRAGVPSPSADKLITAWCSKEPQKVLTSFKNQESVPLNLCEKNPIAADYALGGEVGVNGTPALWFPDGRLLPGYLPPAELAKALGI